MKSQHYMYWSVERGLSECGIRTCGTWSDFQGHHTISLHSGLPSICMLLDGDSAMTNTMHQYNNHSGGNYTICQQ